MITTTNPESIMRILHKASRRAYQRIHKIKLQPNQIVHHIDHDKRNNSPDNLHLFNSNSEHIAYHHFLRGLVYDYLGHDTSREAYKKRSADKIKASSKAYYEKNKQKYAIERINNREKIKQYRKEYYKNNKEVIDARNKAYLSANKDKINAQRRERRRKVCEDKTQ